MSNQPYHPPPPFIPYRNPAPCMYCGGKHTEEICPNLEKIASDVESFGKCPACQQWGCPGYCTETPINLMNTDENR